LFVGEVERMTTRLTLVCRIPRGLRLALLCACLLPGGLSANNEFQPVGSPIEVLDDAEAGASFGISNWAVAIDEDGNLAVAYYNGEGQGLVRHLSADDALIDILPVSPVSNLVSPSVSAVRNEFYFTGDGAAKAATWTVIRSRIVGGESNPQVDALNLAGVENLLESLTNGFGCEEWVNASPLAFEPLPHLVALTLRIHCNSGKILIVEIKVPGAVEQVIDGPTEVAPGSQIKGASPAAFPSGDLTIAGDRRVVAYPANNDADSWLAEVVEFGANMVETRRYQVSERAMGNSFDQLGACGTMQRDDYWIGFIDQNDDAVLVSVAANGQRELVEVGPASRDDHIVAVGCDPGGNVVIAFGGREGNNKALNVFAFDRNGDLIDSHVLTGEGVVATVAVDINETGQVVVAWSGDAGVFYQRYQLTGEGPPHQITATQSGSWFPPTHSGEGWLLEVIAEETANDEGVAVAYWFTYPPAKAKGASAEQAWIVGVGSVSGDTIVFNDAVIANGGTFGSGFDPDDVSFATWGNFSFTFDGPDEGSADYESIWGSGQLDMERITSLAGHTKVTAGPGISGSWYDPKHSGEGWLIEVLSDKQALIFWFSFDSDGNQAWFVGAGTIDGKTITVEKAQIPRGGAFGPGFNPGDVSRDAWGSMTFTFDGCNSGTMSYASSIEEFGFGTLNLQRITGVAGLDCS